MNKYIVKADMQAGGGSPEYAPDRQLRDGLECDGFLLMTMRDGRPGAVVIMGVTTLDLARLLADGSSDGGSTIHQAIAIADGLRKAVEIDKEYTKTKHAREIADMLMAR